MVQNTLVIRETVRITSVLQYTWYTFVSHGLGGNCYTFFVKVSFGFWTFKQVRSRRQGVLFLLLC